MKEDEMFSSIFTKFSEKFPPASLSDFTIALTTDEIFKTFAKFYPGNFSESDLFSMLIESGYKYVATNSSGSISIKWCLKESH